jgi:hypothetical protein
MPAQSHAFKRLVLGLHPSTPDRAMTTGVELASLLHLELLGLFLEDIRLQELAGIPFLREFRLPGGGWRPINPGRLSQDLERAAQNAERFLTNAARELSTKWRFEVIRGQMDESFGSVLHTGDIAVVVEPSSPTKHATQQFSWLAEAAFRSASAVMLVPSRTVRPRGPIVTIAAMPNDRSIHAAAAIAVAAKEELVIVQTYVGEAGGIVRELAELSGLKIRSVLAGTNLLSDPASLSSLLHRLKGRLLVLTRSAGLLPAGLLRGTPVLAIGLLDAMKDDAASQTQAGG